MASQAEIEQARRTLDRVSKLAAGDLTKALAAMRTTDRIVMSKALGDNWVALLEKYGDITAALAAEQFETQAEALKIAPKVVLSDGVDPDRAIRRLGWAVSTADQLGNLRLLFDELVKQPYRSTIQNSAWRSRQAWARVPSGREPCNWCLLLASRGAVYHSKELAQFGTNGKTYHGDCSCIPTLLRGPQDYPEGYDPAGLYDQYQLARQDAGSGNVKDVTAAMRERFGGH